MEMKKTQVLSDRMLVKKLRGGDPEALLTIYHRYRDYLLSVAMALVGDLDQAEDAVHDVIVSLARNRREFRLRRNLKACLAVCVANRTRDLRRRQRVRATVRLDPEVKITSGSSGPAEAAMLKEQCRRLVEALGQLPEVQREVLVLRHKCDLPLREIARLQQAGISTVHARYSRGLDTLRALMNGECDDETGTGHHQGDFSV
jgi:RNA polymerase sigma-70 factor (ECF subfamily)